LTITYLRNYLLTLLWQLQNTISHRFVTTLHHFTLSLRYKSGFTVSGPSLALLFCNSLSVPQHTAQTINSTHLSLNATKRCLGNPVPTGSTNAYRDPIRWWYVPCNTLCTVYLHYCLYTKRKRHQFAGFSARSESPGNSNLRCSDGSSVSGLDSTSYAGLASPATE
jgi:hypothetical protein